MENDVELWREAEQHWSEALKALDKCENTLVKLGQVGQGLVNLMGAVPVNEVMPFFAVCLPKEVRGEVAARHRQTIVESITDSAGPR